MADAERSRADRAWHHRSHRSHITHSLGATSSASHVWQKRHRASASLVPSAGARYGCFESAAGFMRRFHLSRHSLAERPGRCDAMSGQLAGLPCSSIGTYASEVGRERCSGMEGSEGIDLARTGYRGVEGGEEEGRRDQTDWHQQS